VSAPAAALVTAAVPPFVGCTVNTLASGALYQLCFPPTWNGDVVYWAHGYVDPSEPVQLPNDAIGGTPVAAIVTGLGYGYATTSYRANGLIADKAVDDLNLLAATVAGIAPQHGLDLLVGASEGGLSTMLAMEQGGSLFEGGLSTCGPVGSFRGQIDYLGDFRVVFDYFFPNVIPGSAISIPPAVIANWESVYVPTILATLQANPAKTQQLLKVTRAPIDAADPTTIGQTVIGLLWYNVHGTNDAVARLGGNPFDNRSRLYFGSGSDFLLNLRIDRYRASTTALSALGAFETTGRLRRTTQALHTTGDPIIPFWHEPLYFTKTLFAGSALRLVSLPADRYGHCNFTVNEALASFALLVLRVSGQNLFASADVFPTTPSRTEFLELARAQGADPYVASRGEFARALTPRR
jgi:hypothetical protein